jgi:hypothetical protein
MDEIANTIRTTLSTTSLPVQVEPRMIFTPTCPSVDIYPAPIARDPEAGGMGDMSGAYVFTVRARFNMEDSDSGQDLALAMMNEADDLCLGLALFEDQDMNGYASSVSVGDPTGFLEFSPYMGVQWQVSVIAAES